MIGSSSLVAGSGTGSTPPSRVTGLASQNDTEPVRRGRILIVEDDYLVALSNEMALTDAGYEVVGVADSGEAALAMATEAKPDLVLMDIRLAGEMDGIETALALRERGIGSLFASANSDPGTIARGKATEPLGWLRKPFSDHALTGAVEQALAGLLGE